MGTPGDPKADMLPVRFQVRAPGRKFRGDGVGGTGWFCLPLPPCDSHDAWRTVGAP